MRGVVEERVYVRRLDDATRIHHDDTVGDAGDNAEIMRDDNDRRTGPSLHLPQDF
jgi:hypothetical protein